MADAIRTPAPVSPISGSDTGSLQGSTSDISHLNGANFASAHLHFGGSPGISDSGVSPPATVSNFKRTSAVTNGGSSVFGGVVKSGESTVVTDPGGSQFASVHEFIDATNAINAKAAELGGCRGPVRRC